MATPRFKMEPLSRPRKGASKKGQELAAKPRRTISKTDLRTSYKARFADRLRKLLFDANLDSSGFVEALNARGLDANIPQVNKWIRGDSLPRPDDMPVVGAVLGLSDYRMIYPER